MKKGRPANRFAVLESMPAAVIVTDLAGVIIHANPAQKRMLSGEEVDPAGKRFWDFHPSAKGRESLKALLRRLVDSNAPITPFLTEFSGRKGEILQVRVQGEFLRGAGGSPEGLVFLQTLLTGDAVPAELETSGEKRYQAIFQNSPIMMHSLDREGRITLVNRCWLDTLGFREREVLGRPSLEFLTEPSRAFAKEQAFPKFYQSGSVEDIPVQMVKKNGEVIDVLISGKAEYDGEGNIIGTFALQKDITRQKRAELEVAEQQRLLQTIFDTVPNWLYIKDRDLRYRMVNKAMADYFGKSPEDFIGKTVREFGRPQDVVARVEKNEREIMRTNQMQQIPPARVPGPDGTVHVRLFVKLPLRNEAGEADGIVATSVDLTDRANIEEELRKSERLLQTVFDTIPHSLFVRDANSRFLMVNSALAGRYGLTPEEFKGRHILDLPIGTTEDREGFLETDRIVLETGRRRVVEDVAVSQVDGTDRHFSNIVLPLPDEGGGISGLVGIAQDITDSLLAGKKLRESEEQFRTYFDHSPSSIFLKDLQGLYTLTNARFDEWCGIPRGAAIGKTANDLYPPKFADMAAQWEAEVMETLEVSTREIDLPVPPESILKVICTRFPVMDGEGRLNGIGAFVTDVTSQRKIEEQLRESQKLDAIGQLAGGVAHEFNNMLQVIQGYTLLMLEEGGSPGNDRAHLKQIQNATHRASELTSQMLAFSRRQSLNFQFLELNNVISRLADMLRRLIGENIDLIVNPKTGTSVVYADQGMLEQVVLNLCINARDAMADGGTLVIDITGVTADPDFCAARPWAQQGEYLVLSLRDEGAGMSPEVLEHIFEPFFTTKEVGEGTGLGLSMALGIIQQHHGRIEVESQPGAGSTFSIYLPQADGQPAQEAQPVERSTQGGKGTILVAEDEEQVLNLVTTLLEGEGYEVVQAVDGLEALLRLGEREKPVDLALIDVVMPRMGGIDLYRKITEAWPSVKILFTTGYDEGGLEQMFIADHNLRLIPKPYTPGELFKTVRETLALE